MSEGTGEGKKAPVCPICGKPAARPHAPFCSARCKRVDLNRWLGEVYVVPGADGPANGDEQDEESEAPDKPG